MSLWMLLLIVLLAVTAVLFFSFSMSKTADAAAKRRYRTVAIIALVAAVGLVVMGVLRGRSKAVFAKKGKRVKFENNAADELDLGNEDLGNDLGNDLAHDGFLDDFDDLPRHPGIAAKPKAGAGAADATALLSA